MAAIDGCLVVSSTLCMHYQHRPVKSLLNAGNSSKHLQCPENHDKKSRRQDGCEADLGFEVMIGHRSKHNSTLGSGRRVIRLRRSVAGAPLELRPQSDRARNRCARIWRG